MYVFMYVCLYYIVALCHYRLYTGITQNIQKFRSNIWRKPRLSVTRSTIRILQKLLPLSIMLVGRIFLSFRKVVFSTWVKIQCLHCTLYVHSCRRITIVHTYACLWLNISKWKYYTKCRNRLLQNYLIYRLYRSHCNDKNGILVFSSFIFLECYYFFICPPMSPILCRVISKGLGSIW